MRIAVTGADGFIGWHTRIRLRALTDHEIVEVTRSNWHDLRALVADCDAVIHLAGVNRADDAELVETNAQLAREVADAVLASDRTQVVVYSNSIQSGNDTPYGDGKARAAEILNAALVGRRFVEVRLPNIFGEHCRPGYNSFVATFASAVVAGYSPDVTDRDIDLLHVQDAAQVLIDSLTSPSTVVAPPGHPTSVKEALETLQSQFEVYQDGDIPTLKSPFEVALFNTLRASMFPAHYPIPLVKRADNRGSLTEVVRAHGSEGQTFVSFTHPGITRGQHYHLRKFERFVVVQGEAEIALRKVLSDETIRFQVSGADPKVVDMPIGWAHSITNTGAGELTTIFWTNEIFDPTDTDTHPEEV